MDAVEMAFRTRVSIGDVASRVSFAIRRPRWDSRAAPRLSARFHGPPRFVIAPSCRTALVSRVTAAFPDAARDAAARADRILAGEYDLLGYRSLQLAQHGGGAHLDWHRDPVSGRTAPQRFWADVPYLDAAIGDHKVIWEINRHQHWLTLGRAYWLTGDPRYRDVFVAQLGSWMDANPPLCGINWSSMLELSFRSLSWIWALNFFLKSDQTTETWPTNLLEGIDRQLGHVRRHLSYYFSPNTHLLGEALALFVAGSCLPELRRSADWKRIGRDILRNEIRRQIARDGGHVERSTHYHRYTLDFYLLALAIARLNGDEAAADFADAADRLAGFALAMADGAGHMPHIGDDDGGLLAPICGNDPFDVRDPLALAALLLERPSLAVGGVTEQALWMAGALAPDACLGTPEGHVSSPEGLRYVVATSGGAPVAQGSEALSHTGYYVSRVCRGAHLVIDGGPHGYLNGGHAHADALALTLSVHGRPVLIDPGTGTYTMDASLRNRFRSSALHNSLTLDGRSSAEPAGPFHWRTTADVHVRRWISAADADFFEGAHDGYRPLRHERAVLALVDGFIVFDAVRGAGAHVAFQHWHLAPDDRALRDVDTVRADLGDAALWIASADGPTELFTGDERTGLGWASPAYGRIVPATTVRISKEGSLPLTIVTAILPGAIRDASAGPPRIERIDAVTDEPDALAIAARIRRGAAEDVVAAAIGGSGRAAILRVAGFETDARALRVRLVDGRVHAVTLVDGTTLHGERQPCVVSQAS
jgi:hypothetical protein